MPSLDQLSEAVASFMEEHPQAAITVVVDATFGHRIDKKELKEFEEQLAREMGWGDHAYPLPPGHQQPPPITPRMLLS